VDNAETAFFFFSFSPFVFFLHCLVLSLCPSILSFVLSLLRLCDDDGGSRKQSSQFVCVCACTLLVDKHAQQQTKGVCFLYDDKTKQFFFLLLARRLSK
jgi:hypothetical protein